MFGKLFHKRSIIIISERKTNHIALSGVLQFSTMMVMVTCVVWASYSTGRYMATRNVLQERDETIKSVASSRIDTNFNYTMAAPVQQPLGPVSAAYTGTLTDPAYTLSAVNHDKLFARIALLENKVRELKSTNAEIIQTVREKTHNKILNMEEIIRQTGLNVDTLKDEAGRSLRKERAREADAARKILPAQGGPFIPADTLDLSTDGVTRELEGKLDQMALLSTIIEQLPLGMPVAGADLQSNFGRRVDPFTGRLAFHAGTDLSGPVGAQIKATGTGKVVAAGWEGAYGNAVDIDHGFGIITRYGHMASIGVSVGDAVKKGQFIGIQGSTGRSTGAHVHYEVRHNDRPLNPINFMSVSAHVPQTEQ